MASHETLRHWGRGAHHRKQREGPKKRNKKRKLIMALRRSRVQAGEKKKGTPPKDAPEAKWSRKREKKKGTDCCARFVSRQRKLPEPLAPSTPCKKKGLIFYMFVVVFRSAKEQAGGGEKGGKKKVATAGISKAKRPVASVRREKGGGRGEKGWQWWLHTAGSILVLK